MEKFDLAPAEWNIMECLWERAPQTGGAWSARAL